MAEQLTVRAIRRKNWKQGKMGVLHGLTTCNSKLGLADVLIYDIADAKLLLLLLPHQLHTLVNKNVLFLCLHHGHPVGPHVRHQAQYIYKLMVTDVL